MDYIKKFFYLKLSSKRSILSGDFSKPTWAVDVDGEVDSRTNSSSEAIEVNSLLFSPETAKRRSGALHCLSIILSPFNLETLLLLLLIATSSISVLYFVEHVAGLQATTSFPTIHPSKTPVLDLIAFEKPCGDSAEEARARGCLFDVMSFAWLPEQCYDQGVIDDFLALHDWDFYFDKNRTMPVSMENAMAGEYAVLYVSHEYHVRHCTLLWRKMHRALLSPTGLAALDGYVGNYDHTTHCEHMLIDWRDRPFESIDTGLVRHFPSCGMIAR